MPIGPKPPRLSSTPLATRTRPRFDLHEAVTNQIVAAIEEGTGTLEMPWHSSGAAITRPKNTSTGTPTVASTPSPCGPPPRTAATPRGSGAPTYASGEAHGRLGFL